MMTLEDVFIWVTHSIWFINSNGGCYMYLLYKETPKVYLLICNCFYLADTLHVFFRGFIWFYSATYFAAFLVYV